MLASATGYRMSNSTVVRRSLSSALRSSIRPIIASPMVLGGGGAVVGPGEEAEAQEGSATSALLSHAVAPVGLAPWPHPQRHPLCRCGRPIPDRSPPVRLSCDREIQQYISGCAFRKSRNMLAD